MLVKNIYAQTHVVLRLHRENNRGAQLLHNLSVYLNSISFDLTSILDPRSQRAGSYKIGAVIVNV